jgi:hypothetical protein
LGYATSFWMDRWAGTSGQRRRQVTLTVALASWLLLVILVPVRVHALAREYAGRGLFRTNVDVAHFPERAVKFLREIRIPGRMYNVYSWGGFLAHFLPESPTFIDGRSILYDEQFYLSYKATRRARKGWKEFLDRHGVTFAIISKHKDADLFQAMIGDRDWTWVFSDEKSAILLRESPANRELLKRFDAQELPLPDTGDTYFLYGMRAVEKRDYALAAEGFATACERSPDRDLYRSSLIRALGSAGRLEEARREADRALADFPDSDRIVRESALLDSLLHRIE